MVESIKASNFIESVQRSAFHHAGYVHVLDATVTTCSTKQTASSFSSIVTLAEKILAENRPTTEQKFNLGISLAIITSRVKEKPLRWYALIPIFGWIYSYRKYSCINRANKVVQQTLSDYQVATNRHTAKLELARLAAGKTSIWQEGDSWHLFQKRLRSFPFSPQTAYSFSSYRDFSHLTGNESAEEYYQLEGLFHRMSFGDSEVSFLAKHGSTKPQSLLMTKHRGNFVLFSPLPSLGQKQWIKKTIKPLNNIHFEVQQFHDCLNSTKWQIEFLRQKGLFDHTKNEQSDFSALSNGQYVLVEGKEYQSLYLIYKNRAYVHGTKLSLDPKILLQIEQIFEQVRLEEEQLQRFFGGGMPRNNSRSQSHRASSMSTVTKTPQELMLKAKDDLVKLLDPTHENPARVSFVELDNMRKIWLRKNSHAKSGKQGKVKQLNDAWDTLQRMVHKQVEEAPLNQKLMQKLDTLYPSGEPPYKK